MENIETTFERFRKEVEVFLNGLLSNPLGCQVSDYLNERGFNKKKLVGELIKCGIIDRTEKVKDNNDSGYDKPTYIIKYKVYLEKINRKLKRLYIKYFEKNLPEKKENDIDESTSCSGVGGAYDVLFGTKPISRQIAESNVRRVIMNESQLRYIQENLQSKNG